jgi:hypothetical protein
VEKLSKLEYVSNKSAENSAGCLQSTPTSTSTPAPTASTSSDAHENDTDDDSDSSSDSDSGIIEGYPTTAYSGLEANMQMSEGSTAGYKIGEWGLIWGSLIGMGLGVLL